MLTITTSYAGTGPEEIETLITKPIEDNVSTISGLKKITSTSSEGVSTVMLEFNLGTNIDVASSDVRSKLDALRNTLPQDAKAPVVDKAGCQSAAGHPGQYGERRAAARSMCAGWPMIFSKIA